MKSAGRETSSCDLLFTNCMRSAHYPAAACASSYLRVGSGRKSRLDGDCGVLRLFACASRPFETPCGTDPHRIPFHPAIVISAYVPQCKHDARRLSIATLVVTIVAAG